MNTSSNEVIERVIAKYDLIFGLHGRWRPICGHFVHVRLANSPAIGCDGRAQTGSQLDSPSSRAPMEHPG